jgi:hypothetical protein
MSGLKGALACSDRVGRGALAIPLAGTRTFVTLQGRNDSAHAARTTSTATMSRRPHAPELRRRERLPQ